VLILDEPTVGIDPIQVAQTRELIKELGRQRTILLSTHILPEVSNVCGRVIIIHQGRIVARDPIEALSTLIRGGSRIRLRVSGPPDEVSAEIGRIAGIQVVSYEAPYHLVSHPSDQSPHSEITQAMVRRGWTLLSMTPVDMSLEEIFLSLTAEEKPGP
jgi:ABC-2 type transport system ATP-binding protein